MSGQCTGWVLRHGPHPEHLDREGRAYGVRARGLRAVLGAVADAANADGENAHPGIQGVVRGSLYARRQAINLLQELVLEGWLQVTAEGGGRGMATTYRVCMDREQAPGKGAASAGSPTRERVQPAPETVQSAAERVQPGVHPNGVATETTNGTPAPRGAQQLDGLESPQPGEPAVDALSGVANRLARAEWDRRKALGATPVCGFMAVRQCIKAALDAGHPEATVAAVLPELPAWSRNAMDFALAQRGPRRQPANLVSGNNQDRATAGRMAL